MSDEQLVRKFDRLARRAYADRTERILQLIWGLDTVSAGELVTALDLTA